MKNNEGDNIDNLDFLPNDTGVSPTDLKAQDIEKFGQENMPFIIDSNKSLNTTMYDNSKKIDEYISIGNTPDGVLTERIKKKKIKIPKKAFIILIFIVIFLIGFGIYYFLFSSKKVALSAVKTKDVTVSVGDKLSLSLDDYATFNNIQATNCILNISGVDTSKIGEYDYYISCGVNKYNGKIIVKDNTAPEVVTKFVVRQDASDIKAEDFIVSCNDISECSYSIKNLDDLISKKNTDGIYDVKIEVKDNDGNTKTVTESLVIQEDKVSTLMICTNSIISNDINGNYYNSDYIAFLEDGSISLLKRNVVAYFDNDDDYKAYLSNINDGKITMDGVSGSAITNEDDSTISLFEFVEIDANFIGKDVNDVSLEYMFNGYSCQTYNN